MSSDLPPDNAPGRVGAAPLNQRALPGSETPAATRAPDALHIDSLDMDAQGVARRADGKVVFVEGALPGELVSANVHRRKNNWEMASLTAIHRESSQRVEPACPHFGLHTGACGGCKLQHLHIGAQVAAKQRVLEDNLRHLGKVRPDTVLRPIEGPAWGYRYRARLSVRYVRKKGTVLVGFHERKSRYIADMQVCPVLPPHVGSLLMPLRTLIAGLQARETCPQIELACGDDVTALVLRHMEPLSVDDLNALRAFGLQHGVQWWLQPKGPHTAHLMDAVDAEDKTREVLSYALPAFGVVMPFRPTDFTQVNPFINRVLVAKAIALLDVQMSERVIDWFCGLGNFTLPLATRAGSVLGVEGSEELVHRARENYESNRALAVERRALAATKFIARDLFGTTPAQLLADGAAARWLLDPPRDGAFALVKALAELHRAATPALTDVAADAALDGDGDGDGGGGGETVGLPDADSSNGAGEESSAEDGAAAREAALAALHTLAAEIASAGWERPRRIVYVSCNPATLARDADVLVHQAGYRLSAAGVVNMFSHTAHVESIAVFDRVEE